jgi:BirA family biotin operon repressor/biotin-[acetyl-CoA-carboxylase] ligase
VAELPSTSDLLIRLAAAGEPEGLAVLAHRQTAGRGRDGRAWVSPPGNLHLSVLLRPAVPARQAPLFALLGGVALAEALAGFCDDPAALRLKWPNDVLLADAKLGGMLCETATDAAGRIEWLVYGFGANLAAAPALGDRATIALPRPVAPERAAAALLRSLTAWRARPAAEIIAAWVARGPAPGSLLTLRTASGESRGRYAGLGPDGALLLDDGTGPRRHASGEVDQGGGPHAAGR